jgi:hypothetical protein
MKTQARQTPTAQQRQVLEALAGPKPLASVATSFVGLDRPGAANNGSAFFPPDTIVAKSSTRVLEGVNSALRLFTTTGGILATQDLNSFFGASTDQGLLFDPKVYFDRNATNRRFYIVALQQTGTSDESGFSRIWLAVSRSSDPADLTSSWCRYAIGGRRNTGTSLSSWADYPGLGVGADKLVISANQFTFAPPGQESFTFAIIRVLNKLTAANNASGDCPTIPLFTFQPSNTIGDGGAFTLQPAQHYSSPSSFSGTSNPAYLVNTLFGSSTSYRVWRVRNIDPPTLQGPTSVSGNFMYDLPPDADQPNSSTLLDTGDVRVTQVAGLGNAISGVHGTVCNFTGGTPNEACVRYVRIVVGQSSTGNLTASINDQLTFGFGDGSFSFFPGVAVNNSGQAALDYHWSASSQFLSSVVTLRTTLASFFINSGTCAQTLSDRTGDYIGAQTDPSDFTSFWLAGERATTISDSCQWETQIIKLVP